MSPAASDVRREIPSDRVHAATTFDRAFGDDPIMSWMIGRHRDVSQRTARFFNHLLRSELARGHHLVDIATDGHAVALWHDVEALYTRYGFEARGRIALPGGAPPIIAMWRDPR